MRNSILTLFGLFFMGYIHAQNAEPKHCGTVEYIEHMDKVIPGFKESANQAFMEANKLSKSSVNQSLKQENSDATTGEWYDTTYCIPVVFHVLISPGQPDVVDSVLKKFLSSMNDDFNRRNMDTTSTPLDFKNTVSGCNIEFVLAAKDSAGQPFSGIKRKNTNFLQFNLPPNSDKMKLDPTVGSLAVDPDRYLNFWVCNLIINGGGNGLLGFAQPPLNHSFWPPSTFTDMTRATDGVALDESVFANFAKYARVLTHEVGHYLSLRHIWADKSACATPGDYIDDTPDQDNNGQGTPCGQTVNTCSESPKPNVQDMNINYMSYHPCQTAFSRGQANQMRSVLKTSRPKLGYVCKIKGQWVSDINNTNPIAPVLVNPNPVTGVAFIKVNLETSNSKSSIRISDNMGRVVYEKDRNDLSYIEEVDCSEFAKGVYIVEVVANGFKNTTKFIKE